MYILATAIKAAKEWDQMQKVEKGSSPLPPSITAVQHSASFIVRSDAAWPKEDKKACLEWSMQTPTTEVQQKKTV